MLARADFTITHSSATLLVGNLLDGLFTLLFLELNVAREANPLMSWAYSGSPLLFMAAKLGLVHAGLVLLCLYRGVYRVEVVEKAGALLYGSIVCYELACLGSVAAAVPFLQSLSWLR
jgi:hypothetical protein